MGTEGLKHSLHSGTIMRSGYGVEERHSETALQRLPRADNHWTSLRNVWLEIMSYNIRHI